jgi:hypothetical protein
MKLKVVCKKLYDYVRYDLKEIAFPSSLPDPPHIKKRRKLTWHERFLVCSLLFFYEIVDLILKNHNFNVSVCFFGVVQVLKEASRLYAASWVRDIGPDLRPNDYKKFDDSEDESESESKSNGAKRKTKEREPSTLEDLGKTLVLMSSMYI